MNDSPDGLSGQARMLLDMAGITVSPHPSEPGIWVYTTLHGEQGRGSSPMNAATAALGRLRLWVLQLEARCNTLVEQLATTRTELTALREQGLEGHTRADRQRLQVKAVGGNRFDECAEPLTLEHLPSDGAHSDM